MSCWLPAGNLKTKDGSHIRGGRCILAGERFGLRAGAGNLTLQEMKEGMDFVRSRGAKGYLTVNIIPHNHHLKGLEGFLEEAAQTGIDGMIVSDLGIFQLVRDTLPKMDIHISTQANTVNTLSASSGTDGARRIVLAGTIP